MEKPDTELPVEKDKKRVKIIYVDDSQCSLVTLKRRLMGYYEIYPAESSETLFKILEKVKPELILLDINMPKVSGYQVIENLKKDERYSDIPVIFLTSTSNKKNVVKALELGAVDYVIKPFETIKLIECIEEHLKAEKSENIQDNEDDDRLPILAVDDVVSILKTVKYALRDNYKVHTLSTPECLIEFLKLRKVNLILLDYLMPALNGFECIPMIRALPAYKETPIIMLTTEGKVDQIKEAMALGASDFIVKPFKENELLEKVAKHIR